MRTWQELQEEAEGTGTFTGFSGDGASVPWLVAGFINIPLGFTLAAYKVWLDFSYPEAFRLHDWTYTPYGSLIGVTQEEADDALREHIVAIGGITSTLDADVVWSAVRLGGWFFFGVSQEGFDWDTYNAAAMRLTPQHGGHNMASAGKGQTGMIFKVVVLFELTTARGASIPPLRTAGAQRQAGWSESFWISVPSYAELWKKLMTGPMGQMNYGYLPLRADLLTSNALIVGVRVYEDGSGKGQLRAVSFRGTNAESDGDIPQLSLLCHVAIGGTNKVRRMTLRGIPDNVVRGGEFNPPDGVYSQKLINYGRCLLVLGSWVNVTSSGQPLVSISDAGLIQLDGVPLSGAIGQSYSLRTIRIATGVYVSEDLAVTAKNDPANQCTVAGWTHGAGTGGTIRRHLFELHDYTADTFTVVRVVTRQVGRPFSGYRGRASKRRRK